MKAFGDMGQTARLRVIRDRLIAGHGSCELRIYLDSVPPETLIRDVEDRCRVWKSHADPEIRRISKPGPEPIYPAYVVGESDNGVDEVRVATDTKPKSPPDQVEDLLRRLLASMVPPVPVPAPVPEVLMVEKLLQRLVAENQGRQLAPVIPAEPVGLEKLLQSYLSGQQTTVSVETRQAGLERFGAFFSSTIQPQDPGDGAARLVAPREVVKMDVMNSPEESVVEPQSVPSRISVMLVEEAKVGGAQRVQCPRVDQDLRLVAGVAKPTSVTVCEDSHESPSVEGTLCSPDLAGKLFPPAGRSLLYMLLGLLTALSYSDLVKSWRGECGGGGIVGSHTCGQQ